MAKIHKRGKAGAAKNYITRGMAQRRLQITLADFRRLCILKGIFPRQPKNLKKANKGSTAPTTFYYAKDIAFLQHDPVIRGLREHKAFAKKLSRAIGRKEWSLAKNLNDNKPVYKLDHIIKERYPNFRDSLKDIDDALSLLTLFANLPASDRISSEIVANCARLCVEWQLYVMKSKALKKVFLSIKGVYFQVEVQGESITWLVPYQFTQHVPSDVDFRIMMTFLELYQTLLGFVLYKLYSDENLVYPPKLDKTKDAGAAGIGALSLDDASVAVMKGENTGAHAVASTSTAAAEGKKLSNKVIKKQIASISRQGAGKDAEAMDEAEDEEAAAVAADGEDEFVEQPSKTAEEEGEASAGLLTLADIQAASTASQGAANALFTPYVFYISRECPRPILEFVLKSFGASPGKVGWDEVAGAGSAVHEDDPSITHHIVDRPITANRRKKYDGKRVFVQPQWIIDCANARKLLPTDLYGPGKTLPPHLSPFVDDAEVARRGGYVPVEARAQLGLEVEEDESSDEEESEEEDEEEQAKPTTKVGKVDSSKRPALTALLADPLDSNSAGLLDAAELEAEVFGGDSALEEVRSKHSVATKTAKKQTKSEVGKKTEEEEAKEMAQMMMSNRKRKLYKKLNYTSGKRSEETAKLEQKRKAISKKPSKKA